MTKGAVLFGVYSVSRRIKVLTVSCCSLMTYDIICLKCEIWTTWVRNKVYSINLQWDACYAYLPTYNHGLCFTKSFSRKSLDM